jgi:hypothetical protein
MSDASVPSVNLVANFLAGRMPVRKNFAAHFGENRLSPRLPMDLRGAG